MYNNIVYKRASEEKKRQRALPQKKLQYFSFFHAASFLALAIA